jgi:hypothetical protein
MTTNVEREARKLAAALAAFLHLRRWEGVVTGPAEVVGFGPDNFDPDLDQYEVWKVEWSHVLHLGKSVWEPEPGTVPPTTVYARPAVPEGAEPGEQEKVTP